MVYSSVLFYLHFPLYFCEIVLYVIFLFHFSAQFLTSNWNQCCNPKHRSTIQQVQDWHTVLATMITALESDNPGLENRVPGTQHLIDLEGKLTAKHATTTSQKDILLIPYPSSDPNDPLNWTINRKRMATASLCMYTLMVGIASAAIYSVLTPISDATGLTLGDLNDGTGYMFLVNNRLHIVFLQHKRSIG